MLCKQRYLSCWGLISVSLFGKLAVVAVTPGRKAPAAFLCACKLTYVALVCTFLLKRPHFA